MWLVTRSARQTSLHHFPRNALHGAGIELLGAALDLFEAESDLTESFGTELKSAYLAHKRFEAEMMAKLTPEEQCEKYRRVY